LTAGASAAVKGVKSGKAGLGLLEEMQDLGTMSRHLIRNERGSIRIFGDIADRIVPHKLGKEVWDLDPKDRGRQIEFYLTETDYKDWYRSDNFINPKTGEPFKSNNFPSIDFQQGNYLVSLKTVNTGGKSWKYDMRYHIDHLQKTTMTASDVPATKILDIRVQPGGFDEAKHLIKYGKERNISVIIKEFGE